MRYLFSLIIILSTSAFAETVRFQCGSTRDIDGSIFPGPGFEFIASVEKEQITSLQLSVDYLSGESFTSFAKEGFMGDAWTVSPYKDSKRKAVIYVNRNEFSINASENYKILSLSIVGFAAEPKSQTMCYQITNP